MTPSFDVFKIDTFGDVLWHCAQESYLKATAYIQGISLSSPGQYLILNQITGDRVMVGHGASTQDDSSGIESRRAPGNGI